MKKTNKALAKDWQQETSMAAALQEQFDYEKHLLWYAAQKRSMHYPSAEVFENAGYKDVANLIRQAYKLLEDAYYKLEEQQ